MSIATELAALDTQRDNLAANLVTKGVSAYTSETLSQLVPKVLDIVQEEGSSSGPLTIKENSSIDIGALNFSINATSFAYPT